MTKWLRRRVRNWLEKDDWEEHIVSIEDDINHSIDLPTPMRFSVQAATGGTIVEVRHYDRKRDENRTIMHVIPDGENIAEHIGKIVTLEMLRA